MVGAEIDLAGYSSSEREFELDAAGLELSGQCHQLGGVAGEALELVDGEDDQRLGRGLLELVGQREGLLQFGPDLDPCADLLLEDLVALYAAEGFELARQFLPAVEVRAYPIRTGRSVRGAGTTASAGPCFHTRPGPRSAGTGTSSSSRSAGTWTKRGVWYFAAVLPPRVRQALPAGASQFGQS